MSQVTLHDVARSAGVSYATVDRVVNARGGVAEKSVERVQRAIDELGYQRDLNAANLARRRVYRFHFVLPNDSNEFFRALHSALLFQQSQPQSYRSRISTSRVTAFNSAELIDALDNIDAEDTDCVCAVALDTPAVIEAIERASARGLKVVTLISDIAAKSREHYIGIDNLVAGRTAGRMMGLSHGRQTGQVLPIIGARTAHDHIERLQGFESVMQKFFPEIELLQPVESSDKAEQIVKALSAVHSEGSQLSGIYNIGAGNEGLLNWLQDGSYKVRPISIIHELVPASRAGLETGLIDAVIDQKPQQTIAEAMRVMRLLSDKLTIETNNNDITPAIYLRENLPPATTDNQWSASA